MRSFSTVDFVRVLSWAKKYLASGPPLHPFLFGLFPVLFLWANNLDELSYTAGPADVGVPVILVLLATLVGWLLLRFLLRDGRKAAVLAAFVLAIFFFYGRVFEALTDAGILAKLGLYTRYFIIIWLAWLLPVAFLIIRVKSDLVTITNLLNVVAVVLVVIQSVNIVLHQIAPDDLGRKAGPEQLVGSTREVTVKPDIYYVVLDAYTSSKNLEDLFSYDNSGFEDFLTSRGFFVADDGRSNYGSTQMSLSSSLNMQHLLHLGGPQPALVYVDFIKENAVMKFLRDLDYQILHFKERWMSDNHESYGDAYIGCENQEGLFNVAGSNLWKLSDFSVALVQTTLLEPFLREVGSVAPFYQSAALCDFQSLVGIVDSPGPKFVFAHMLGAHPPFVFGPDGELPPPQVRFPEYESESNYLGQVTYTNRRMKEIVDEIIAGSVIPPIIIIQGDHGSGFYGEDPTPQGIRERFPIMNALRLPAGHEALYPSISPVNTFRVLFNTYFGTDLELVDDTSYYNHTAESGGEYLDVTDAATAPWSGGGR